jgi:hypothetical protein
MMNTLGSCNHENSAKAFEASAFSVAKVRGGSKFLDALSKIISVFSQPIFVRQKSCRFERRGLI